MQEKDDELYSKYLVKRNGTDEIVEDCFVLRLKDPHARKAMRAYAQSCRKESPVLSESLEVWVKNYEQPRSFFPNFVTGRYKKVR